jgi:hypothetical protein
MTEPNEIYEANSEQHSKANGISAGDVRRRCFSH